MPWFRSGRPMLRKCSCLWTCLADFHYFYSSNLSETFSSPCPLLLQNGANPADEGAADMLTDSEATVANGNAIIHLGPSTPSIAAAAAESARQRNGGAEVVNPIHVVEHETNGGVENVSVIDD